MAKQKAIDEQTTGPIKPVQKWKIGNFDCAVWANTFQKDNRKFTQKSATLRKSWKQDNHWKEQKIKLFPGDIQKAIAVLTKAQEYMLSKDNDKQAES